MWRRILFAVASSLLARFAPGGGGADKIVEDVKATIQKAKETLENEAKSHWLVAEKYQKLASESERAIEKLPEA